MTALLMHDHFECLLFYSLILKLFESLRLVLLDQKSVKGTQKRKFSQKVLRNITIYSKTVKNKKNKI